MSIIENPKKDKGMHYGQWLGDQKALSHRDRLRAVMDAVIAQKPANMEALFERLREDGYEIKTGKQPSFRGKEQKRFIRLDSLGTGYSMDDLLSVLVGEKTQTPQKQSTSAKAKLEVNLLVDIQRKLQAGKGVGYERWAKVFNLKQMAQTMNYLMEHGLADYNELSEKASAATDRFHALSAQIKTGEKRIAEIAVLRTHIQNYIKTRNTYTDYRKAGYSAKFRTEHESEILLHQAAKRAFDELGVKKLPTVKSLNAEYAELLTVKRTAYLEYRQARNEMRELLTVKTNVDQLLEGEPRVSERDKSHKR
jgi:predicted  nucleic acid-binding Zn-ribbon protein